ncbi:hypothetical protein CYCD_15040 [Tenuifilaceae bacterium CYCD]|nr:hypothetical protein CYCD_15040 [Tenuifilaceae bacterium CYCD]
MLLAKDFEVIMIEKIITTEINENRIVNIEESDTKSSTSSSFALTIAYSNEPVEIIEAIPAVVDIKAKKPKSAGEYK